MANDNTEEVEWLSSREASKLLPFSRASLIRYRKQGFGPKFFKRGGVVRYKRQDILDYIERYTFGGDAPPNARHASGNGSNDRAA